MGKKTIPAINESELDFEKPVSPVKLWIKEHMAAVYIGAAILLIIAIFFGIRIYNNKNHPITKLMSASAKDFNSSFSFEVEADLNGKTMMKYTGTYEADAAKQNVKALYDADYGDYQYTGVVYSQGETRYSGSLYNGKWRVRDCSEKVLHFFDFNTDYKAGRFDAASFLRFTGLTSQYSADELNRFMKLFKSRMNGNSELADLSVTKEDDSRVYTYDISLSAFFELVRDKGASIFFSAIDYDAFCKLYEMNEQSVKSSECRFSYTINNGGWMSAAELTWTVDGDVYSIRSTMDDFGKVEVTIPDGFMDAVDAL